MATREIKKQKLTPIQALDKYFGGIKKMEKSKIPFRCECGEGVFSVEKAFKHIREFHVEIKLLPAQKGGVL